MLSLKRVIAPLLLLATSCRSEPPPQGVESNSDSVPDSPSGDSGPPDTDTTATDTTATDTTDTGDSALENNGCTALPALGDTTGGGGRVQITLATTQGVTNVLLGGAPLADLQIDSETQVSGVPTAHEAGVVDIAIEAESTTAMTTCTGAFEYWTPRQIVGVSAYLDADKGVNDAGDGHIVAWESQTAEPHVFLQYSAALQPRIEANGFGSLPAVRFDASQSLKLTAPVNLSLAGSSIFAVAKWTATQDTLSGNAGNVPLTIVGDSVSAYGSFGASGGQVASNHYIGNFITVTRGEGLNDGVARLIGATYDTVTETKLYIGNAQQGLDDYSSPIIGLNSYDTIGAGYAGLDGWNGDIGAVVIVSGVISVGDRTKLDLWAQQRFGTPTSAPLDTWTRSAQGSMPTDWYPRDGSQMVQLASGRILMIGGWSPYDPWGGDRVTNEVWASDDSGTTWSLLLAHDTAPPTSGVGARFPPGHTVGVAQYDGHAIVMGTDCLKPPLLGEVWQESDNGATWTRVTTDAPTVGRCLFMVGNIDDDLYMMGGQAHLYDEATAIADVWRSSDGGVTWTQLDDPPWSGRGMVYRPVEQDGVLTIVGGGRYDEVDTVSFNGVYSFDGATWTTVLPDGHAQWEATYYNASAALNGRIWLFNGYTATRELQRALYSDDAGATWSEFAGGSGGVASHADDVLALDDRILRMSGSLSESRIWAFSPE